MGHVSQESDPTEVGSPGTEDPACQKAVAGEAKVPLLQHFGSDFVEMFVESEQPESGICSPRLRKNAPCIVFIDEIDAVARRRARALEVPI